MLGRPGGFGGAAGLVRFTVLTLVLTTTFFAARTAAPAAFLRAAGLVLALGGAFFGAGLDAMARSVPGAGLGVEPDWGAISQRCIRLSQRCNAAQNARLRGVRLLRKNSLVQTKASAACASSHNSVQAF